MIGLTGCGGNQWDFPTSDNGFPIGATRMSDGAQLVLGMHLDDAIELFDNIRERRFENLLTFDEEIGHGSIRYNDDGIVYLINLHAEIWQVDGGFSVGDELPKILDRFSHLTSVPGQFGGFISIYETAERSTYRLRVHHTPDERNVISAFTLTYMPIYGEIAEARRLEREEEARAREEAREERREELNRIAAEARAERAETGAPRGDGRMTLAQFNSLTTGMTHSEVAAIVGSYGTLSTQSELGGTVVAIYSWQGHGSVGANALITFQNNRLQSKAQVGLQ